MPAPSAVVWELVPYDDCTAVAAAAELPVSGPDLRAPLCCQAGATLLCGWPWFSGAVRFLTLGYAQPEEQPGWGGRYSDSREKREENRCRIAGLQG